MEQPYLRRNKDQLYREASSIIICGKESQRNNFELSCDMPTTASATADKIFGAERKRGDLCFVGGNMSICGTPKRDGSTQ